MFRYRFQIGRNLFAGAGWLVYRYHQDHFWVRSEGQAAVIGFSFYAQAHLGRIVFLDLPKPGQSIKSGEVFGEIESAKTTTVMVAPLSGRVLAANAELAVNPELINESPLDRGWVARLEPSVPDEWTALMDLETYQGYLETQAQASE